jgi:hypothetical protein
MDKHFMLYSAFAKRNSSSNNTNELFFVPKFVVRNWRFGEEEALFLIAA